MPLRLAPLAQGGRFHCTAAAAAAFVLAATLASAQQPAVTPGSGDASFGIFLRGAPIGREQANVARTSSGWIVTSTGSTQGPLDFTISRFETKYAPDWQPLELTLEARLRSAPVALRTSFALTTAINEITENNRTVAKEDQISARTIVLPNNVFGAYEVLAARLSESAAGAQLPVYVALQAEVKLTVKSVTEETLTGPDTSIATRRYDVIFHNPDRPLNGIVVIDNRARLVRFELPDVGLLVVRDDAASVAMRSTTTRNPTDVDVSIPANGFNLAGTITTPPTVAGRLRHPVVVLVGGTAPAGPLALRLGARAVPATGRRRGATSSSRTSPSSRSSRAGSPTAATWSFATIAGARARAAAAPSRPPSPTTPTMWRRGSSGRASATTPTSNASWWWATPTARHRRCWQRRTSRISTGSSRSMPRPHAA